MVIVILLVLGLCLGSFVNALVWRLHEKQKLVESGKRFAEKEETKKPLDNSQLSIVNGRSICPNCRHRLVAKDLVPILSWLTLKGKCRYCAQPISWQYPLVELLTATLFVFSYIFWPYDFASQLSSLGSWLFVFWLIFLTGFIALAIYDLRWYLLPDKIMYPLLGLAVIQALLIIFKFDGGGTALKDISLSLLIGGGIFYGLFQVSKGKWIGGGDVKLGALIGLVLASPTLSLLMIFTASLLGSLVAVPMLLTGHAKRDTHLPFGPFLIAATIIVYIFGTSLIAWYKLQVLSL